MSRQKLHHKHLLATIRQQFGHQPFRACELMLHLDSAMFGVEMLEHIRATSGQLTFDGERWRLRPYKHK